MLNLPGRALRARGFHPPQWAWLLVLAALALFATLGTWQLRRGTDKQARLEQLANPGPVQVELNSGAAPPAGMLRAQARGHYLPDRQLLQEGPAREGRPGYQVWTPLRLDDGGLLMVNRGWIPQPSERDSNPVPPVASGSLPVHGWWRDFPAPGLRLAEAGCAPAVRFPATVVYPRQEQVECLLGERVLPGLLLLDADQPGGFVREWTAVGLPPERHFGYAVTWYGLGVTALFLFVKLNLKSSRDNRG